MVGCLADGQQPFISGGGGDSRADTWDVGLLHIVAREGTDGLAGVGGRMSNCMGGVDRLSRVLCTVPPHTH